MDFIIKGIFIYLLGLIVPIIVNGQETFQANLVFTGEQALDKEQILSKLKSKSALLFSDATIASSDINVAKVSNNKLKDLEGQLKNTISKRQNDAAKFAGIGGLSELRQTISEQQLSKDNFQKDFEKQLQQSAKTRGLFLVVLPNTNNQNQWDAERFKSEAQKQLKVKAIKELNKVFISAITTVIDKSDVKQRIESKVSGVMAVEQTAFEKRRPKGQDYIMLMYVSVSPLSSDNSTNNTSVISNSIEPKLLINCLNEDDVNSAFETLGLSQNDENELRSKISEYVQQSNSDNIISEESMKGLWKNMNAELQNLNSRIEEGIKTEKEKTQQLSELVNELDLKICCYKLNDSLTAIKSNLDQRRNEIIERRNEIESKKYYLKEKVKVTLNDGSPIEAISEAIYKAASEMNTSYRNKVLYSENIVIENKQVVDEDRKEAVIKIGNLSQLWVNVYAANDDEYQMNLIAKFDVKNDDNIKKKENKDEVNGTNNYNKSYTKTTVIKVPPTGQFLFRANCATCHHPIVEITGPILKGVTDRRNIDWLFKWISNGDALKKSGDKDAVELYRKWNNAKHIPFALSDEEVKAIIKYLKTMK